MDKIILCSEGFLAMSGDVSLLRPLAEWLDDNSPGAVPCERDGEPFLTEPGSEALVVSPDGSAWLLQANTPHWIPLDQITPIAIGSGAKYAIGAAWAWTGLDSAAMAVRIAALFDPGTKVEGGVQTVYLCSAEVCNDQTRR